MNSPTLAMQNVSGKHMEPYYFAGYYLMKLKPDYFGSEKNKFAQTCSGCINTSVFGSWCLSWTHDKLNENEKLELGLTDDKILEIEKWTDDKFNQEIIKWGNAFPDLETATTFKNLFFPELTNINIYSIYLSETDTNLLIEEFRTEQYNKGHFGLRHNLMKRIKEQKNLNEEFIGFDFIGVEIDGRFHSFYCHHITEDLTKKFSLNLNQNGLFEEILEPKIIREYLNDEVNGLEPIPWYIAKTKRLKNVSS